MKVDFKYKVVVVTGATGGIGRALSWRFASAGARIVLMDVDEEQLPVVQNQIERSGADVLSIACDISDNQQCQAAMQQVTEHFGGIDLLINNAGVSHRSRFEDTELAVFEQMMAVNYFGALYCAKAALTSLIERRGMIVNLSSTGGFAPMIGRVGYSASKHALHGLFESLRLELKEKGVHVMMVCPGATATEMHKSMLAGDGKTIRTVSGGAKKMATPQEVADAIFEGAQNHKRIVIHSKMSKMSWFYWKFFPSLFERKLYKQWRIELGL